MTTDERLEQIDERLGTLALSLASLCDMLRSALKQPPRGKPNKLGVAGFVTHPTDLGPAIAGLSDEAREHMYRLLGDRAPTPESIAEAADWSRENRSAA